MDEVDLDEVDADAGREVELVDAEGDLDVVDTDVDGEEKFVVT